MRFGVDARRNIGGSDFARIGGQFLRVLPDRDRMKIDHAIDAFMRVLQTDEIADRAQIIAQMQIACRLHARKNAIMGLGHQKRSVGLISETS